MDNLHLLLVFLVSYMVLRETGWAITLAFINIFLFFTFKHAAILGNATPDVAYQAGIVGSIVFSAIIIIGIFLYRAHKLKKTDNYIPPKRRELAFPAWVKHWIVPAIIFTLVVVAFTFRWDYTTTQTIDSVKMVYKIDRWTGDRWIELYGLIGDDLLSGKEIACDYTGVKASEDEKIAIATRRENLTLAGYIIGLISITWLFLTIAPIILHKNRKCKLRPDKNTDMIE